MLDIVTVTTLYPNTFQPRHGIFVEQRLLQLARSGEVSARVVAPVPWFPWRGQAFGRYARYAQVPALDNRHGLEVAHPRYPVVPKIGMHVAPALMALALLPYFRALKASATRPFLLDAHFLYPDGVAAVFIARRLGVPVVLTARGSDVNRYCHYPGPRAMIQWAARHCAALIAVSDALRVELLKVGVCEPRVAVLRNGVDTEFFRPTDRAAARQKLGYEGFTLLSVGNLIPLKGHHLVIEALASLPGVSLVTIGEGPDEVSLRALIRTHGVSDRVAMLRNVSQADLVEHYNAADALVLASETEGMPNVVLESLACGTPVIATRAGGVPEVITSKDAGIITSERSAKAIAQAVCALQVAYTDRLRTRQHALAFGWEPTVRGTLEIFRRALDP